MKLTQERLKELFDYREDGNLIRKITTSSNAKIGDIAGGPSSDGYVATMIDGKSYLNHRLIWCWHKGYFPENDIDHKDRIRHHNWIDNLREVSQQCNSRNQGNRIDNTSGVKGVNQYKSSGKWMASIGVNKKIYHLGYFKDFDEAVCHRLASEQCLNWEGCDMCSPAYLYVKNNIQTKNIFRGLKRIKKWDSQLKPI